jgi:hypothetical protein
MSHRWTPWERGMGIAVASVALCSLLRLPAAGGAAKPKINAARKLLEKIKLVDGEGSGLDADTVRGKTLDNALTYTFRVVDSGGRELGVFTSDSGDDCNVARREGGTVIRLLVSPGGVDGCYDGPFYHETADCSGTRYLPEGGLMQLLYVPRDPGHAGHIGYYAGEPIQSHMFASVEWEGDPCPPGYTPSAPGFCCGPSAPLDPLEAGPAVAFDLSPFTAPFKIE